MASVWKAIGFHWRNTLYSNVWISLGAAAWIWSSEIVLGHSSNGWLPFFGFCSTISLYNFQRIVKSKYRPQPKVSHRVQWMGRNSFFLWMWTILGAIGVLFCLVKFSIMNFVVLAVLALISLLYIARIFKFNGEKVSGRQLPFVKIWMIGITWAAFGTLVPGIQHEGGEFVTYGWGWLWFAEILTESLC